MSKSIPTGLTEEHILAALADLDGGIEHSFGDATGYHLVRDGKKYAPKAVVGIAFRHFTGVILSHTEFSGGERPGQANYVLKQLGFTVEPIYRTFITSGGNAIPEDWKALGQIFWFNMWQNRKFPFRELNVGDTLYWYDSQSQKIVWKSTVAEIDRFEYASKDEVRNRLINGFGEDPKTDPYFAEKPDSGYCIAYRISPFKKLDLPKPEDFKFPRLGWLRGDEEVAANWLSKERKMDGKFRKQIQKLSTEVNEEGFFDPKNEKDERERKLRAIVQRRGQPAFRGNLLSAYDQQCAVTGCKVVETLEAAHISPYKGEHSNHVANGILLRADIHTLFDLQLIGIDPDSLTIQISDSLIASDYEEFQGKSLMLPKDSQHHPSQDALNSSWTKFKDVETS